MGGACSCCDNDDTVSTNSSSQGSSKGKKEDKEKGSKRSVAPFEHGEPEVEEYDEIYGCFREEEVSPENSDSDDDRSPKERSRRRKERERKNKKIKPGKLYRLVQRDTRKWYFYNDTKDYNMVVTGYFGPMNELISQGKTRMWREMPSGLIIAELVVEPLQTEAYIEGTAADGFDLRFKALPKKDGKSDKKDSKKNREQYEDDDEDDD